MKKNTLKTLFAALCCVVLLFALAACSALPASSEAPATSNETAEKPESVPAATAEPTPAPEEPGAVPTPAPEGEENEQEFHGSLLPMPESGDQAFVAAFMENPIDQRYLDDLDLASSMTEIADVNNAAAESWKNQIDAAYMHILEIGDEETVNRVKAEQEAWLDEQNAQLQTIRDQVDADGAVAAVNVSENIMLYYRSRAIDLCAVVYSLEEQITFG